MIGHMRHGSSPRLLALQSILSPSRRESLPAPSAGDYLSGPTLLRVRAQPIPDHALEPADGGLGAGSLRVAGGCLPCPAAPLSDELEVTVPLRGLTRGCLARHRRRAWRHDDSGSRMALADA